MDSEELYYVSDESFVESFFDFSGIEDDYSKDNNRKERDKINTEE